MLKIWLTWLQPSLGLVGAALLLSEPLSAFAATKSAAAQPAKKATVPTQPQWTSVRTNGTRIDAELASSMAATPDLAIRQIAVGALNTGNIQAPIVGSSAAPVRATASARKVANLSSLAVPKPKNIQAQKSNSTVAAALARALQPSEMVPVPGLYIGNSDVKVSQKVLPAPKPLARAIASADIGTPTPLAAMMGQKITSADPFPVVRPETMQKIQGTATLSKATPTRNAPILLDPIATMPGALDRSAVAKTPAQIKASAPNSLDPIAAIPTGLQQVLGNNLGTSIAIAPVAKPSAPGSNSTMVALGHIITPDAAPISSTVARGSLQLATAQAYNVNSPKFSIPGEPVVTAKAPAPLITPPTFSFSIPTNKIVASVPAKPTKSVLVVRTVRDPFAPSQAPRKGYAIASNSVSGIVPSSWLDAKTRHNLGGLILGGQQLAAPQQLIAMPTAIARTGMGLPTRSLVNFQ